MAANDALAGRDLAALEADEPSEAELLAMGDVEFEDDPEEGGEPDGEQPGGEEGEQPEEGPADPEDEPPAEADDALEGQPDATPASPAGRRAPAKPSKPQEPVVPVRFRVAGQDHELEDSLILDKGDAGKFYVIKEDVFRRRIQPMLGDPRERIAREQHYKRQLAEKDHAPELIVARIYSAKMDEILDSFQKGDREPLDRFLENPDASVRELRLAAREAIAESGSKLSDTIAAIESEPEEERRITEQFQGVLYQGIEQVLSEPEYKKLGLKANDLFERFWEVRGRLFPVATREYCPPGITMGDRFLDLRYLRVLLGPASTVAARAVPPANGRKAKLNAAAAGAPGGKPTATAPARGQPARQPKKINSKESWAAAIAEEARRP